MVLFSNDSFEQFKLKFINEQIDRIKEEIIQRQKVGINEEEYDPEDEEQVKKR